MSNFTTSYTNQTTTSIIAYTVDMDQIPLVLTSKNLERVIKYAISDFTVSSKLQKCIVCYAHKCMAKMNSEEKNKSRTLLANFLTCVNPKPTHDAALLLISLFGVYCFYRVSITIKF